MPASREGNEHELVQALRARDETAYTVLVGRHHASLVRIAASVLGGHRSLAEEVVQETWLAVLRGIADFQERSSFKTWLFRILVNRARTRAGREGRSVPFSSIGGDDGPLLDPADFNSRGHWARPQAAWPDHGPEEVTLSKELGRAIREAIDALPAAQRAVVTLRDVEGLASEEVCNVLELTESNQRVLLHRGRTRVRQALAGYLAAEREGS